MSKPTLHDRINKVLDVALTATLGAVVAFGVYQLYRPDRPAVPAPSGPLLVECAPIARGETIRVLANRVTMESGTTRYFDLSDSSFHQTTAPCATFEVRGE